MKIFLDTANLDQLRDGAEFGIIDGVTTNPSLIAKEGNPIEEQIPAICEIIDGDVSAEVIATTAKEMVEEGRRLAKIHPNVVVKVPLTRDGIKAPARLSKEGIRCNVTLCFSPAQALLAAKAGAYIVSPFVGRLDDIGVNGMDLIRNTRAIYQNFGYATQILVASIRSPLHVIEAAKAGGDIATLPFKTFDSLFNHPLTDQGLAQFLADWGKVFEESKITG